MALFATYEVNDMGEPNPSEAGSFTSTEREEADSFAADWNDFAATKGRPRVAVFEIPTKPTDWLRRAEECGIDDIARAIREGIQMENFAELIRAIIDGEFLECPTCGHIQEVTGWSMECHECGSTSETIDTDRIAD